MLVLSADWSRSQESQGSCNPLRSPKSLSVLCLLLFLWKQAGNIPGVGRHSVYVRKTHQSTVPTIPSYTDSCHFSAPISMSIKTCKVKPDTQFAPRELARIFTLMILVAMPSIGKECGKTETAPLIWEKNECRLSGGQFGKIYPNT